MRNDALADIHFAAGQKLATLRTSGLTTCSMIAIEMGIWVNRPTLAESETVRWERAANRTQSANRAVGGRLFLTETKLLFEPNRVDAALGGVRWSAPLASILAVGTQQRDGNPLSGGMRTRLRLDLDDGSVEVFVVNHLDEVIGVIQGAVAQRT